MDQKSEPILSGVRVLEIAQYIAGPLVGRMMADMGADVVKLELPPVGDGTRAYGGAAAEDLYTPNYVYWNRGKQSICIDFKRPEGARMVKDLVRAFDVVIENFSPGVLSKYGLDYGALREVNSRLIMCSISGFGQTGPLSDLPGNDTVAQAMSGVTFLTGNPGESPVYSGFVIADCNAAVNGLAAICAALFYRGRTGTGQYIDLSLLECLMHLHDTPLSRHLFSRGAYNPVAFGPHLDHTAPCGIFKASHGYVVICVLGHQWQLFTTIIGKPELASDPRFADPATRAENRLPLAAIVEEWLQSYPTREEPIGRLQAARLLAAPVLDLAQAIQHPQTKARGLLQPVDVPGLGNFSLPRVPFHFSETPVHIASHVALLGEDNSEVLAQYLHYSDSELEKLGRDGVVFQDPRCA